MKQIKVLVSACACNQKFALLVKGCSEEQFNRIVAILFIGVGIYYSIIINN